MARLICLVLVLGLFAAVVFLLLWLGHETGTGRGTALRIPVVASPPALSVLGAEPLGVMDDLFDRTDGWIGADGAHSVPFGPGRTLWLFSDTWVGAVKDGKRFDATIVNNSAAVQNELRPGAAVRFAVRLGTGGKPTALVEPADGRGWFWLQAGTVVSSRLVVFLSQVEKTGAPGVFGFRQIGQWVGVVADPGADPTTWQFQQHQLPHAFFTLERELTFGAALLPHGGHVYVYGTDEDVTPTGRTRHLVLARVPADRVERFDDWEFFRDGHWQPDFRAASRLVPGMASDCSVTYSESRREFVLVYTDGGLSERVLARTALTPWGPWSEPAVLYTCPEPGWDPRVFCYNAKAHGSLSAGDELVVSYVANSFDFWHVAADASLYRPRFVRVRLAPRSGR